MKDEHVKKIIEKTKDEFKIEIFDMLSAFNKSAKELFKKQADQIDSIYKSVAESSKALDKIIELNKLHKPAPVNKGKKVDKKPDAWDDHDEGDL